MKKKAQRNNAKKKPMTHGKRSNERKRQRNTKKSQEFIDTNKILKQIYNI